MPAFADTSILVAAMITTEAFHAECETLVGKGRLGAYAHGLVETFHTLTGGGKSFRLKPGNAAGLLEENFGPRLEIVSLTPSEIFRAFAECESRGVRGGAIFDYLHLVAARKAKAERLYTLNISNFRSFHRAGDPEIVHP